jgi:hypothetical protein
MQKKRFCKGCQADVTDTMFCYCGEFPLSKEETLSESELLKEWEQPCPSCEQEMNIKGCTNKELLMVGCLPFLMVLLIFLIIFTASSLWGVEGLVGGMLTAVAVVYLIMKPVYNKLNKPK